MNGEIKAGDVVETWTAEDGQKWEHVWIIDRPGLLHLVWRMVKP